MRQPAGKMQKEKNQIIIFQHYNLSSGILVTGPDTAPVLLKEKRARTYVSYMRHKQLFKGPTKNVF